VGAVVVAAGSGRRFGDPDGPPKQFRELRGTPILRWALEAFLGHSAVGTCVVVLPAHDVEDPPAWLRTMPVLRVAGGAERSDSVRNGVAALGFGCDIVLVHDGARPLVQRELIDLVISAASEGAVVPGLRVTDTVKEVAEDMTIRGTADRDRLWTVQTPQAFPLESFRLVHERARREGVTATDDAALFERYGIPVRMVEGDPTNVKITSRTDLALAEVLAQRLRPAG
jgi:2-C-methyl-D-erythritol 4-phosphate cytidylyltransferase